ncbi:hypothetical protein [Nocardia sp. NPDC057455]
MVAPFLGQAAAAGQREVVALAQRLITARRPGRPSADCGSAASG